MRSTARAGTLKGMDTLPIWLVFIATVALVAVSIEMGFLLGRIMHRRSADEKESPVSAMTGAILALLAFMLAFTFGITSDRFDARKALVRDEANAIGTAYLRTEFLPEPDRSEAKGLFRRYVNDRVQMVKSQDMDEVRRVVADAARIHDRLWTMAVANARKDMNSDVAALYIESLNAVFDLHATRVAVGLHARVPTGIWIVLYVLIVMGMMGMGYQSGIAGSRRTWASPILAIAFSIVVALIAALDIPGSGYITVSQQPLEAVQASFAADAAPLPEQGVSPR